MIKWYGRRHLWSYQRFKLRCHSTLRRPFFKSKNSQISTKTMEVQMARVVLRKIELYKNSVTFLDGFTIWLKLIIFLNTDFFSTANFWPECLGPECVEKPHPSQVTWRKDWILYLSIFIDIKRFYAYIGIPQHVFL